jgi:hypothetical protein
LGAGATDGVDGRELQAVGTGSLEAGFNNTAESAGKWCETVTVDRGLPPWSAWDAKHTRGM